MLRACIIILALTASSISGAPNPMEDIPNSIGQIPKSVAEMPEGTIHLITNDSSTVYRYYSVELLEKADWFDRDDFNGMYQQILKNKHRSFQELKLKGNFRFYGHIIDTVIVTSGGFIHTDEFRHSMLTHSMYIAPFMADLHTSDSYQPPAKIFLFHNETLLILWWENIRLYNDKDAFYTFQLVYHSNGVIIFNYDNKLTDEELVRLKDGNKVHSLKVGISDARYITHRFSANLRVQFMLPYHTMEVPLEELKNHSSIIFTPLPTCVEQDSCEACIEARTSLQLDCLWCPVASLCSDGLDRFAQHWIENTCDVEGNQISTAEECSLPLKPRERPTSSHNSPFDKSFHHFSIDNKGGFFKKKVSQKKTTTPPSLISNVLRYKSLLLKLFFIIIFVVIGLTCIWTAKSFRNPNTIVGRWFIQNTFLNRWRERREVAAVGGSEGGVLSGALNRMPFTSTPTYVAFHNSEDEPFETVNLQAFEQQETPQPPMYQPSMVVNERAYAEPPFNAIPEPFNRPLSAQSPINPPPRTTSPTATAAAGNFEDQKL